MKRKIFIIFLLFAYLCSVGVRYHQYQTVTDSPVYSSGGRTILTAHDGYRWLRYASEYQQGTYTNGPDRLAGVPNINKPPELPLISYMTAKLSDFAGISLEKAGGIFSVFLPGLFVFPLGMFFYITGFPAAGIGASLMGALSFAYLSRTSAFQIDTDMLNFFWLATGTLFLVLSEKGRSLIWSAVLGLTMYIFWRWYFHSGFTLIYFVLLLYALRGKGLKTVLQSCVIYLVTASPFIFASGVRGVFEFIFPSGVRSVYADVAELQTAGFIETLSTLSQYWYFALIGLLLSFMLRHNAVYLVVFYVLGLLAFFKGVRFAMFFAPVCGAGIGLLFDLFLKGRYTALKCSLVTALMILFLLKPFLGEIPPPVTDAETYTAIKKLNETEPDSIIGALWDNGFLVQYLTGRAVFADGASQFKNGAEITSKALFSADSNKAASMLSSVSGGRPVYLLFTPDMDKKLPAIIESAGLKSEIADENGRKTVLLKPKRADAPAIGNKITSSLYFRLHVIGDTDIECFSKFYSNNRLTAIYRVAEACM